MIKKNEPFYIGRGHFHLWVTYKFNEGELEVQIETAQWGSDSYVILNKAEVANLIKHLQSIISEEK